MHHIVSSCQKAKNIIEDLKSDPTLKPITSQVWVAQNNFDIMMLICFYFSAYECFIEASESDHIIATLSPEIFLPNVAVHYC
jgi:hypothetical protein